MGTLSRFSKVFILTACVAGFSLPVHAGFEWVPAAPKAVEKPRQPLPEKVLSAEPVEVEEADLLPLLPLDAPAAEPVILEAPKPQPITVKEVRIPQPSPVLDVQKKPEPAVIDTVVQPEIQVVPIKQDVVVKKKIVVSEDAPDTAIQSVKSGLKIDVRPLESSPMKDSFQPNPTQDVVVDAQDVVDGFGSDIPLALALQQVIPAGYAYSFAEDVNPGQRVSWDGGKPWIEVVNDMVAPLSLVASVRGNMVYVHGERHSKAEMLSPVVEQNKEPSSLAVVEPLRVQATDEAMIGVLRRRQVVQDPGEVPSIQPAAGAASAPQSLIATQGDGLSSDELKIPPSVSDQ